MQRFTLANAWMSFLCGVFAFCSIIDGSRRGQGLSDMPRPHTGPGFSESATAVFGGALLGWWIAAIGILLALMAQVVGPRRGFKFALGLPALVYFLAPFFLVK